MMQEFIVAVIVACATWAVAKRYAPKAVRIRIARAAKSLGWSRPASSLEANTLSASPCLDGCGSCGGCDSSGTPPADKQFAITPEDLKRTRRSGSPGFH